MIFCQNKLCRACVEVPDIKPGQLMNFTDGAGVSTKLRQIKIRDELKKEFDFCEVCANVLAIVHGK